MQQEQPQFYATLASHLSAEEQSIIQNVYNSAEQAAVATGAVINGSAS
jgi:hemerythrin superfamily protein